MRRCLSSGHDTSRIALQLYTVRVHAAAGRAAEVDWSIAEQDEPVAPLEDIGRAYRYLASLTG